MVSEAFKKVALITTGVAVIFVTRITGVLSEDGVKIGAAVLTFAVPVLMTVGLVRAVRNSNTPKLGS
jgi:hypothetical protein